MPRKPKPVQEFSSEDHDLIEQIIERAQDDYGSHRIRADRLRKALCAAHRAKPIRLNDLLHTCIVDFYNDVFNGAYRHYDEATDTMKNGWTAQHSEPIEAPDDGARFINLLSMLFNINEDETE